MIVCSSWRWVEQVALAYWLVCRFYSSREYRVDVVERRSISRRWARVQPLDDYHRRRRFSAGADDVISLKRFSHAQPPFQSPMANTNRSDSKTSTPWSTYYTRWSDLTPFVPLAMRWIRKWSRLLRVHPMVFVRQRMQDMNDQSVT